MYPSKIRSSLFPKFPETRDIFTSLTTDLLACLRHLRTLNGFHQSIKNVSIKHVLPLALETVAYLNCFHNGTRVAPEPAALSTQLSSHHATYIQPTPKSDCFYTQPYLTSSTPSPPSLLPTLSKSLFHLNSDTRSSVPPSPYPS